MEKIPTQEIIDDMMADVEFAHEVETRGEPTKYIMSCWFDNVIDIFGKFKEDDKYGDYSEGEKFEFVHAYKEKGDGYDEETLNGIFERKSDGKHFEVYVHDDGSIGSGCLTMGDEATEVNKKVEVKTIITWE